jgi:hypothetical protein
MLNQPLTGREIQIVQLLIAVAIAVFVGLRFLPPRFRRPVGVALTGAYLFGIAAFAIYVMAR